MDLLVVCALTSTNTKLTCSLSEQKRVRSIFVLRHILDNILKLMKAITMVFMLSSGTSSILVSLFLALLIGPSRCGICKSLDLWWHLICRMLSVTLNGLLTLQQYSPLAHLKVDFSFGISANRSTLIFASIEPWNKLKAFMLLSMPKIQFFLLVIIEVVLTHSSSANLSVKVTNLMFLPKKKEIKRTKRQSIQLLVNLNRQRWRSSLTL